MAPKNVERNATMPTIIATVECAGRSGWFDRIPRNLHALRADLAEHRERPSDVGDARVGDLLLAERLRRDKRQQETPVLDEHVVELPDELPGQLLFVGLLGNDGLPRPAEVVDEVRERQHEGLPEQAGLGAEVAEQQVLGDAGGLGDLARRGAAVVLPREQLAGGVEQ